MDEKLLIRGTDSHFEAFAELYHRNITRVYRYHIARVGNPNDAEELTSQTFITALKELPSFRGRDTFATWVFEIGVAKCLKDQRGSRQELSNDAVLYYQISSLPSEKTATQRMEVESISHTLKQIPYSQAEALILHHFSDLTHSEISLVLKKSTDTIGTLISRGLEDLRTRLSVPPEVETIASDFEDAALIDKLSSIAAQINPDPLFVAELEQVLAANYRPKRTWSLPLQQISTTLGWVVLMGLGFFLLNWRVTPSSPSTQHAATSSPTSNNTKIANNKIAASPTHPIARPTATKTPTLEYIVQAGDTCTYIANRYGTTIDQLITLNHLNSTCDIWVDQKLMVPITTSTPSN